MPELKDKYSDQELNPADFEREFANRAGSPAYDQAHAEMGDAAAQEKSSSPEAIKNAEEAGSGGAAAGSSAGSTATNFISKVGGPEAAAAFTTLTALKSILWGSKRRKQASIGAGVAGALTGGGLLMLVFISGPLELIHLAQTLEKGFSSSEQISDSRGNKLLRYATAKDAGETRLGILEKQYLRGSISELEDIGVKFQTSSNTNLNGVEVDTTNENLQKKFPELEGMSQPDQQAWLADKLGVSADELQPLKDAEGKFAGFSITKDPEVFLGSTKALLSNVIGSFADGGSLSSAMKARIFAKYFDIPSIFHPLQRAAAGAQQKVINAVDAKTAEQDAQQAEEGQAAEATVPGVGNEAEQDKEDENGDQLGKALFVLGGVCDLRQVGNDIKDIDRALVVAPAAAIALRFISIGSQIESGKDFSASQLNGILASLSNGSGQSVFSGDALEALEGSTDFTADQTGLSKGSLDLPESDKQAFLTGKDSAGYQLTSYTNGFLNKVSFGHAGIACNTGVQIAIAIGTTITEIAEEVGSAGTATPAVIAEISASQLAKQIPGLVISAGVADLANHLIINGNTAKALASDAFSGPVGGDLLAYGARAAGNTVALSSGAIMDAGSTLQSIAYNTQQQQQAKQQFETENFFARMFDIHDYRSLVGRLATSISPSFRQNIFNFASDIGNFGSVVSDAFTNLFAAIFPHASAAATATYNWGFPQATIPDDILNSSDITMDDPYWNACELFGCSSFTDPVNNQTIAVAGSIANQQGQITNGNAKTIAEKCFNLDLTYSNGQWGGTSFPQDNVDPNSQFYIQNCQINNPMVSSQIFERLMLFAADTTSMSPMACLSGDDQSCSDIGFAAPGGGSSGSSGNTGSSNSGSLPSGSAQQLAQEILNNSNVGYELDAKQDIQDAAAGKPGTAGAPISQTLLQLIDYLAQSHKFNISALESHGEGHSGPGDPHYEGDAVDIVNVDGDPTANSGIGRTNNDIAVINQLAPVMPKSTGSSFGQESGFGQSQCGTTPTLPTGIVTFSDTCSHLHIQIPEGSP